METRDRLLAMPLRQPTDLAEANETGVYAWWDPARKLPFPPDFPQFDQARPVYIGLASRSSLSDRGLKNHLKRTRSSTLRRSLAPLLDAELGLRSGILLGADDRLSLATKQESLLTAWMIEQLRVTWVAHPSPEDVEQPIIDDLLPPLNDDFAHRGPYWLRMRALKSAFRGQTETGRHPEG